MKIIRQNELGRTEYEMKPLGSASETIRAAAQQLGRTNDSLELYDDNGECIAAAVWPQGAACYKYSVGKDFNVDPHFRVYKY